MTGTTTESPPAMPPAARDIPIRIRLLTPTDAALYRQIRLEGLERDPQAFASTFAREREKPLAWFAERLAASDVFGAFLDDELAGVAGYRRHDGTAMEHKAVLWGMYVRSGARRFGLGKRLVDAVAAHAAERVEQLQLTVVAENTAALRLYMNAGFVEYGRELQGLKQDGRYFDEVLMTLFLAGRE